MLSFVMQVGKSWGVDRVAKVPISLVEILDSVCFVMLLSLEISEAVRFDMLLLLE